MIPPDDGASEALIRLFHVHKRYAAKQALCDLTLEIRENEFVFVTGPSGAGKTTLLKLLYLGETISAGQVIIDGMNLARMARNRVPQLRRQFGIIFQDYKLIPSKTVYENIALVLEAAGEKPRWLQKRVNSVLRAVGMDDRHDSFPLSLSGGEQQRVAVARAIVGQPKIIVADEPTGSLDEESAGVIMALLKKFHAAGGTLLVATHDMELIRRNEARVVHLDRGCLQPAPPL